MAALNFKTPFELVFQKKHDYTAFRVFGSACYPCLRPYTTHKFEPRSLQCVFLGYNANYKGYQCLYPPTGRIYITRHAIFDERNLPFAYKFQHLVSAYSSTIICAWQTATPTKVITEAVKHTTIVLHTIPLVVTTPVNNNNELSTADNSVDHEVPKMTKNFEDSSSSSEEISNAHLMVLVERMGSENRIPDIHFWPVNTLQQNQRQLLHLFKILTGQ